MNRLYFGDNLKWLKDPKAFPDASVVELIEALKKFLKPSPARRAMWFSAQSSLMMAYLAELKGELCPRQFH